MTHDGPSESEAGGLLTIDLDAIVANWRQLAQRAAPASCAAVVKADGYGCGIVPVATALSLAGCETFFVAHLAEGRAVRAVAAGAAIYVLNGLLPETAAAYAEHDLRPVIGSLPELAEWRAFVLGTGWLGGAALHVDTGMNRLGLTLEEADDVASRGLSEGAGFTLIMSHLACSEVPDHALNAKQIADFRAVRNLFSGLPGSLANSSGIFLSPDAHHDLVRPGVALYGANPTPGHPNPMRPAVALRGRIVQMRDVPIGETVGYGGKWTAQRATRLAIVSIGYADGLLRCASGYDDKAGAAALVAKHRCQIVGLVSMDLLAVDVTDVTRALPRRGDFATFLADDIGVDDLAAHAGTVSYEILTSLGRRYRRFYKGANNSIGPASLRSLYFE